MLEIRLLGPPRVSYDGAAVDVDTRKAIALLAYLAVEHSATRDTMATVFWADASTDRARATLRRTLSSLKSGIGADALEADRHHIALTGEASIDLAEFEAAVQETTRHEHAAPDVCSACVAPLTRATDLYRGDFLEGFSIRNAPDFEDWVRSVAESMRLQAGEAFHRLAMARAADGDYAGAIGAVRRWIELDELHEPAHRLLMLLSAWAGDRPGSVEAYHDFVTVLDRELGVPPLDETTELYEAILDEDLPPAPGLRRRVKAEMTVHPPTGASDLLDRKQELALLRSSIPDVGSAGKLLAVNGRSWMGKTRLIEEVVTEARATSAQVFVGRAFRMEQELPYGVVAQLLGGAVEAIDAAREAIPEWALVELSRLDPRLVSGTQPTENDRFGELRLFEAAHAALVAIASRSPVVIVVDDAQWVDAASADLLSYIAKRIADLPVLMIFARRTGEAVPDPIADILAAADAFTLAPLTPGDVADRISDSEEAAEIIARTGGVPLLVLEAIAGGSQDAEVGGVVRYVESRLHDIGDLGRQVMSTAAVLTGVCDIGLLREVSGRAEEEVVEAVEELIGAGLMREMPEGANLGFTLDALEKILYDSLTLVRRRLLHRRAAEALQSRPRSGSDARIAAGVAAQYRGAGDDLAAAWYRTAGDLSRDVYANSEARSFYEAALALGSADVASLHLALGELAMTSGDYEAALRELRTAAGRGEGETIGLVEHRLGEVNRLLGRFKLSEEHFGRAAETHPRPTELYADWALVHHRTGDAGEALRLAERAISSATDDVSRSRAENVSGIVMSDAGKAMEHLDEAIRLAGSHDLNRMAAINNKAHLLAQIGNGEAATRLVDEAIDLAARTGHRHYEAALRNHLADLYHQQGRREESRKAQTEAMSLFADIETDGWEPEVWLLSRW